MCRTPTIIGFEDSKPVLAACRYCWQCRANRVNDMIGRCIAEELYSTATYRVTLTYAGDGPETAVLTYKNVQDFMKRVRYHGYEVRFLSVGEYGSENGRAHWHLMMFFKGLKVPQVVNPWDMEKSLLSYAPHGFLPEPSETVCIDRRFMWKHWPHGVVYFERPEYGAVQYMLKYCFKELSKEYDPTAPEIETSHLMMSKKPPLGYEYFIDMMNESIEQRIAPQSAVYQFRNVFDQNGKRRKFYLQGRMREIALDYFDWAWKCHHGTRPPASDLLQMYEEKKWMEETDKKHQSPIRHLRTLGNAHVVLEDEIRKAPDKMTQQMIDWANTVEETIIYDRFPITIATAPDGAIQIYNEDQHKWESAGAEIADAIRKRGKPLSKVKRSRQLKDLWDSPDWDQFRGQVQQCRPPQGERISACAMS